MKAKDKFGRKKISIRKRKFAEGMMGKKTYLYGNFKVQCIRDLKMCERN